ncbi:MAG: hypothetical protein ACK4KW_04900 [Gemmobacter sp.]
MRLAVSLSVVLALAGPLAAEAPMSAIDWLSDTVARPPPEPEPPSDPDIAGRPLEDIATTVIEAAARDAVGVLSTAATGLPRGFWAASETDRLVELMSGDGAEHLPATRDLLLMLLLAELDPPLDADGSGRFLLARIDRLLELGALDAANALIEVAGPTTPDLFRRAFDTALLLGQEDAACAELRRNPRIAPTLPARVFCLARGGDWQAASLTLNTAQALGQVDPADEALLERFLDPALHEDAPPLPPPDRPSPLTLRIFEAIGDAIPATGLPLAFAHADLSPATGWKARIEAGERLARAGAIEPARLFALYTERLPAASGGVWDRAAAVLRVESGRARGDPGAVAAALPRVWQALAAADLEVPLAEMHAERLLRLPVRGEAGRIAFRLGLLSPAYEAAALARVPEDAEETFLAGLARGRIAGLVPPDSMARAIAPAFVEGGPETVIGAQVAGLIDQGRTGEAVLVALGRIGEGAVGDRRGITEGLAVLRRLGLEGVARRTALQLMLLERRG